MIGQFRLQRSLQDCFGELFQEAVLADDVFRLLVIGQQLVYQCLVDRHRFPFSSSDGRLHSSFYTLSMISEHCAAAAAPIAAAVTPSPETVIAPDPAAAAPATASAPAADAAATPAPHTPAAATATAPAVEP